MYGVDRCTCRPPSALPMPAKAFRVVPPSADAASPVEAVRNVVAAGSALSMCLITSDFPVPARTHSIVHEYYALAIVTRSILGCMIKQGEERFATAHQHSR